MKVALKDCEELSKLMKENEKPILLFVCKKYLAARVLFSPVLKDLWFKYQEKISFYDMMISDDSNSFQKQNLVYRNPTFLFFKKGKLVYKIEGLVNRSKLFDSVGEFLIEIERPKE